MANLGPFELQAPVGRGGMASVWRAQHRDHDLPVAIKVMTAELTQDADWVRRFADEVRAVAALDHPGIVMVLDHGTVEETSEVLTAGSPWLAMEYASGGTLADRRAQLPWSGVKTVLDAILDALAHAHARGVIHRDLKPANVLLATRDDARPGVKLSDFGIAWAGRDPRAREGDVPLGTPTYMAPEQITASWRDYGPWTDLYALGCLGWWLVTGRVPFRGRTVPQTIIQHLQVDPPPLQARMEVPAGFEDWLRRLLCKAPSDRFQCAADAAHALAGLQPVPDVDGPALPLDLQDTLILSRDGISLPVPTPTPSGEQAIEAPAPAAAGEHPARAPIPASWRRPIAAPPPMQLVGAGLSLYGLRAIPFVGRQPERDLLWDTLREVERTGRARLVLIHGPAGTGKSRLVEWLCERAQEVGAATIATARFSPSQAPGEALQGMGLDWFGLRGASRAEVDARVEAFLTATGGLEEEPARVICEILCPATPDDLARGVRPVRLTTPREHYAGTSYAMYRSAQQRPLIAWFDDIQHGVHGLGVALEILASQEERPFPALLVLTMRHDNLDEDSPAARRLQRVMEQPGATALELGPLPADDHHALVGSLLRLEGTLAARVAERTRGNPLFAVQLVGDWVRRGQLRAGRTGFERSGRAQLPDDLHQLWAERVGRVLKEFPPQARIYLEIAATLGHEVDRAEWRAACDDPQGFFGDRFPGDEPLRAHLVERLVVERLAVPAKDGRRRWSFVHSMLRDSLERSAVEAGRVGEHHLACATMLRHRASGHDQAERLGRHLFAAGRPAEAIGPLLDGVALRRRTVGPEPALALVASCEEALAALPADDPGHGRLAVERARLALELGLPDEALQRAEQALHLARAQGLPGVEADALSTRADARLARRDLTGAREELQQLLALARTPSQAAAARMGLAEICRRQGDFFRAAELLRQADGVAEGSPEAADRARALGRCAEAAGDPAAAVAHYGSALATYEALGLGLDAAECHDRLARLSREAGDLAAAEQGLQRALSSYAALGGDRQVACRMRLAIVRVHTARDQVWETVAPIGGLAARLDHRGQLATRAALGMVRCALDGDGDAFDRSFAEAAASLPRRGPGPVLVAWLAHLAGEAAAGRDPVRARQALQAASAIWRVAGNVAQVAEIEATLLSLQAPRAAAAPAAETDA